MIPIASCADIKIKDRTKGEEKERIFIALSFRPTDNCSFSFAKRHDERDLRKFNFELFFIIFHDDEKKREKGGKSFSFDDLC